MAAFRRWLNGSRGRNLMRPAGACRCGVQGLIFAYPFRALKAKMACLFIK